MLPLASDKLYYLASPYSHPSAILKEHRKLIADHAGAKLIKMGYHIFGPITESACYAKADPTLDGSWDFWQTHDLLMLSFCSGVFVLMIPGWDISKGVQAEIAYAQANGLPICYLPHDFV